MYVTKNKVKSAKNRSANLQLNGLCGRVSVLIDTLTLIKLYKSLLWR